jgi:hypothetical protein
VQVDRRLWPGQCWWQFLFHAEREFVGNLRAFLPVAIQLLHFRTDAQGSGEPPQLSHPLNSGFRITTMDPIAGAGDGRLAVAASAKPEMWPSRREHSIARSCRLFAHGPHSISRCRKMGCCLQEPGHRPSNAPPVSITDIQEGQTLQGGELARCHLYRHQHAPMPTPFAICFAPLAGPLTSSIHRHHRVTCLPRFALSSSQTLSFARLQALMSGLGRRDPDEHARPDRGQRRLWIAWV